MAAVEPELRTKIAQAVAPLDERFRVATVPASRPLFHRAEPEESWYWRMPRNRGPELDEDFTNERIRPVE